MRAGRVSWLAAFIEGWSSGLLRAGDKALSRVGGWTMPLSFRFMRRPRYTAIGGILGAGPRLLASLRRDTTATPWRLPHGQGIRRGFVVKSRIGPGKRVALQTLDLSPIDRLLVDADGQTLLRPDPRQLASLMDDLIRQVETQKQAAGHFGAILTPPNHADIMEEWSRRHSENRSAQHGAIERRRLSGENDHDKMGRLTP